MLWFSVFSVLGQELTDDVNDGEPRKSLVSALLNQKQVFAFVYITMKIKATYFLIKDRFANWRIFIN